MSAGPGVRVRDELRREIEDFLSYEARLADESRYDEWESLVTDDVHYWVPAGDSGDYDPAARLSYVNDNRSRLATRIRQLKTGLRHSQTPPSVMRRVIANVEILAADDAVGEYEIGSNFVLYELAIQSNGELRIWPGRITHRLRRIDGELRIAAKRVDLVTAALPISNLTFLI